MEKMFYLLIIVMANMISSEENPTLEQKKDELENVELLNEKLNPSGNDISSLVETLGEKDKLEVHVFCGLSQRESEFLEKFNTQSKEYRQNKICSCLNNNKRLMEKLKSSDYATSMDEKNEYSHEQENNIIINCLRDNDSLYNAMNEELKKEEKVLVDLWTIIPSINEEKEETNSSKE